MLEAPDAAKHCFQPKTHSKGRKQTKAKASPQPAQVQHAAPSGRTSTGSAARSASPDEGALAGEPG